MSLLAFINGCFTLMDILSLTGINSANDMSSIAKSLPITDVLVFTIDSVTDVFPPEFQTPENCDQLHGGTPAVIGPANGVPFI